MTTSTLDALARRGTQIDHAVRQGASDVSRATALVVADTLACVLTGADHPTVSRLLESQDAVPGRDEWAPLVSVATPRCRSDVLAVDVTAAHVDELDPVHPASGTVPGAVVVPVAVHLGERTGLSGPAFLGAVAAGYEVAVTAALALGGPRLYRSSWWPGAVASRLGAAMTAACVLGLDAGQTRHALALAAASAGGLLTEDVFSDGHYLLLGDGAALGAQSARRAAVGLRASDTLLDGPAGRAFRAEPTQIVDGPPRILDGLHKEFPCATPLQALIRGLRAMGGADLVRSASEIEVALPAPMLGYVSADRDVDGPPEAAASAAYAVAAVAHEREHDVTFFRAADARTAFRGRLGLVAGPVDDAVRITVTRSNAERQSHSEPVRPPVAGEDLVRHKFTALFGPGSPWGTLPGELLTGLAPKQVAQRVRDRSLSGERPAHAP